MEFYKIHGGVSHVSAGGSANTKYHQCLWVKTDLHSGDWLTQVKGSRQHWAHVIYRPRGPRQRVVTKQLHAQLGAGQEVASRLDISSNPNIKREIKKKTSIGPLWTDMLNLECEWSEKNTFSCDVTAPQTILHLLSVISGGVKSEKSWEWPKFGGLIRQT